MKTYLQPEEFAYPHGRQVRKGKAIYPDGKIRAVYAGVADSFFTIPAHGRLKGKYVAGFLTANDEGEYVFHPQTRRKP